MSLSFPAPVQPHPPSVVLRIDVIEDHPLYREALERVLRSSDEICLEVSAGSIEEYLARAKERADVVIVDLHLPGLHGGAGVRRLVGLGHVVLVLSGSLDGSDVVAAISEGARGYVSKDAQAHEILTALRVVAAGRSYVSPTLAGFLMQPGRPAGGEGHELSDREREVLSLVARGDTDQEIASRLCISVSTVRSHLDRIRDKTGQRRRADLTRFALQHAILDEESRGQ
ncbi:MAG: response regulator [Phycicoccus sp.]